MIIQAWLAEALFPSLLFFLLIWKGLGRISGAVVVISKWWYVFGIAATMTLTVAFRYALLFWFGGAEIVSPSGNWNIVISLVLPALAAFLASLMLLRVPAGQSNAFGVSPAQQRSSWVPFVKILTVLLGCVIAISAITNLWLDRQKRSKTNVNSSAAQVDTVQPGFDSKGWTQESTGTANIGPWLDYSPAGTRYYRDANNVIFRVYPPGVKPDAPPANPFGVGSSSETIPPVSSDPTADIPSTVPSDDGIQGEWRCTRSSSSQPTRLVLAPDGSVSGTVEGSENLIQDPWMRWYAPMEPTGGRVHLLRIKRVSSTNIVVTNPNDSIENCVR